MGSDAGVGHAISLEAIFQSTLPHGERLRPCSSSGSGCRYFNPRSRMGSDCGVATVVVCACRISIHAPAWGATGAGASGCIHLISIHAPAWGATWPPSRCRRLWQISIHAPAWGATSGAKRGGGGVFQSTLPHGERRAWRRLLRPNRFQSTLPHGERPFQTAQL